MPDPARLAHRLERLGLRELTGWAQARAVLGWAYRRPGRADGRPSRIWVARLLVRQHRQHPGEFAIAVGHQHLADEIERAGGPRLSRQTVQRIMKEMRDDGVLFLAQRGCSAAVTGGRNHVSVYVVVEDLIGADGRRALADLHERVDGHLPEGGVPLGTSLVRGNSLPRTTGKFSPETAGPQRREHPELYAPRTACERDQALGWLLADLGWRLTPRERLRLAGLLVMWFAAGWSALAVRAALDRLPDGDRHRGPLPGYHQRDRRGRVEVRDLVGVVGYRLRFWVVDGAPGRPPIATARPVRGRPKSSAALPTTAPAARTRPAAEVRAELLAAIAAGRAGLARRADEIAMRRRR